MPESVAEPWGLTEMQIEDPGGTRTVLVEVPASHSLPVTRDRRYHRDDEPLAHDSASPRKRGSPTPGRNAAERVRPDRS